MGRYVTTLVLLLCLHPSPPSYAGPVKNRALEDLDGRSVKLWNKNTELDKSEGLARAGKRRPCGK